MSNDREDALPASDEAFEAGPGVELAPARPYEPTQRTTVWRIGLGALGLGAIAYGAVRILQSPDSSKPLDLLKWLVAALILHDGILAPIISLFGFAMARLIPGRARAYIQGGLIVGALVSTFALVEIYREGKSLPGQSLLEQDYGRHLLVILGIVLVLTVALYLTRVVRDRRRRTPDAS